MQQLQTKPKFELWPVCVGWGDAIFITTEKPGQKKKHAYIVDGGSGLDGDHEVIRQTDKIKIQKAYERLIDEGFEIKRIIATHPDKRHTNGILHILNLEEELGKKCSSDILFTDNLDENDIIPTNSNDSRITYNLQCCKMEFQCFNDFFIKHESITAELKLRSIEKPAGLKKRLPPVQSRRNDDDDKANESSIITTIYSKTDPLHETLACLTADGFFDDQTNYEKCLYNENGDITVFQVPLHGSKRNSTQGFYKNIAGKIKCYLISCGSHGGYKFPDAEILTAIRGATISKKKLGAVIVLTDGKHLTSDKVQSFIGAQYEPAIYYWDEKHNDDPVLRIKLYPIPELPVENLVEWSIIGYKNVVQQKEASIAVTRSTLKCTADGKHLMMPIVGKIQLTNSEVGFEGFQGSLPLPTEPCNWQNSRALIMVDRKTNLVFLQCIDAATKEHFLFRCNKNPWQTQYAYIDHADDDKLKWDRVGMKPKETHDQNYKFKVDEWNPAYAEED